METSESGDPQLRAETGSVGCTDPINRGVHTAPGISLDVMWRKLADLLWGVCIS